MTKHNKSLGKYSTNGAVLSTATKLSSNKSFYPHSIAHRNGGLDEMKKRLDGLLHYLSDPKRQVTQHVAEFVNKAIRSYEQAVKASIGMPTYSSSVTLQHEAPKDIPTLPLDSYQLVQRTCLVEKLATSGTTAGGFNAVLIASDLEPFTKSLYFRVNKVTSWTGTLPNFVGTSFAGVAVAGSGPSGGTEVMPIWSENWTPVGQGFPGIVTQFPLGDFPQYANNDTTAIITHFTALGGTGGVTGIPVVFHVVIECLV